MKRRLASIVLACFAPLLVAADKPVLVPDISARQVQIRYSFSGAQLLLFGAVVYPGGRPPDRQLDIAVVLRGPGPADPRPRKAEDCRHLDERGFEPLPFGAVLLCGRVVAAGQRPAR